MKIFSLIFLTLFFSNNVFAESCSAVIKDRWNNILERYVSNDYSRDRACSEAMMNCQRSLSDARSNGRYYDADCSFENVYDPYPPNQTVCTTNLLDQYDRVVRSFTAQGRNEYEACGMSDQMCSNELYRSPQWGMKCIRQRNPNPNPNPNPYPPRQKTETCTANRFDPAGMFIQSYYATETGPFNTDVLRRACEKAIAYCQRDLKGRQFCNIGR